MGVEAWLYERLGRPELSVVGEVASTIGQAGPIDWICELDPDAFDAEPVASPERSDAGATSRPRRDERVGSQRILIVGGCDLWTTADFLRGSVSTEFAHPGSTGTFIHAGHTETLRQSADGLTPAQRDVVQKLFIVDEAVYRSAAIVEPDYDLLVLSVLTDYTQGLYRHRSTGLMVPWQQLTVDLTDPAARGSLGPRHAKGYLNDEYLEWFGEEFEFLGGITPERFADNIRWLAGVVPEGAQLILVNGAEYPLSNPKEPDRHLRHREMNAALDAAVAALPVASICDVRTFIDAEDDFTDHIRHYRRDRYLKMAEEIQRLGAASLDVRQPPWTTRSYRAAYRFAGRRRRQVEKLARSWRGRSPG